MIESAVASILMRLPVAELSTLRKVFMASRGGLTLESFVGAMLESKPSCSGPTVGHDKRRASIAHCRVEDARRSSNNIKKSRKRRRTRRPSRGRQQRPGCGHRSGEPRTSETVNAGGSGQSHRSEKTGAREEEEARSLWKGVECSLTDEEKVAMVVNLIELFRQVRNCIRLCPSIRTRTHLFHVYVERALGLDVQEESSCCLECRDMRGVSCITVPPYLWGAW